VLHKQTGTDDFIAKRWYMDGSFSLIIKPFMQMWTIHAFVRYKNEKKMVFLIFAIISSRTQKDLLRSFFET
jgi:hypothetical protein